MRNRDALVIAAIVVVVVAREAASTDSREPCLLRGSQAARSARAVLPRQLGTPPEHPKSVLARYAQALNACSHAASQTVGGVGVPRVVLLICMDALPTDAGELGDLGRREPRPMAGAGQRDELASEARPLGVTYQAACELP